MGLQREKAGRGSLAMYTQVCLRLTFRVSRHRADHIHVDVFPTPVVIVRGRGGKVPLQDANDIFERRWDDRHHRRRSLRCCKFCQSKFFASRARPSDISSASRLNDTVCEEARKETQCRWGYRSER